jgi:hypothetical protein
MSSWITFILAIINFNFTLAAPVAIRDLHGVRVSVADVAKDRIAVLPKRMDPDEGQSSVTSDHEASHSGPETESEPDSETETESEELESEYSDSDDSDGGEAAAQWEEEFQR